MNEVKTERLIVGITREKLEEILASAFERHRHTGYFYNDSDYDDPKSYVIVYDRLLSLFDADQRRVIESQIDKKMAEPGVHRIMDQGCGHANSIRELTNRLSEQNPTNRFEGYGVSGSLKDMWLGRREWDWNITPEQEKIMEKYGIYSFVPYHVKEEDEESPVRFFGIERDIHTVMKDFPYELDLVISDNTYFHLVSPWLALKRTVDKLSVGGVVMVRTGLSRGVDHISQRPISDEITLRLLRRDNPEYQIFNSSPYESHLTIAIIKRGETKFRTNQQISLVSEGKHSYIRSFYSLNSPRPDCIAIDTF